jgi:hypothetical protein
MKRYKNINIGDIVVNQSDNKTYKVLLFMKVYGIRVLIKRCFKNGKLMNRACNETMIERLVLYKKV